MIEDGNGDVLTGSTGVMERWKENAEEKMNEGNVRDHRNMTSYKVTDE